jgi:hypothetical protein
MECCYRAYAFDFVNVAARLEQRLSKKGATGRIAEQEQAFRLRKRNVAAGRRSAKFELLVR